VYRLIADAKTQGDKLDRLQHQATFTKGGLAVSVFFITAIVAVAGWILFGRGRQAVGKTPGPTFYQ
jgi:hypothetical protein